jgi:hypothetical protein
VYSLLFFVLLIDPYGFLNLKFLALILIIVKTLQCNGGIIKYEAFRTALLYLIIPCYLLIISIINNVYPRELITVLSTLVVFATFIMLDVHKIFNAQLVFAMKLLIIVNVILLGVGYLSNEYALGLYELLKPYGMISFETAYNLPIMYHNSIFFCIMGLPSILGSMRVSHLQSAVLFASFVLLFKKALFISLAAWAVLSVKSKIWRIITAIVIALVVVAIFCLFNLVDLEIIDKNRIRIDYLSRYLEIFMDPQILLFGHGLTFVDWGNGIQANLIELTYIELVRYVGVIVAVLCIVNLVRSTLRAIATPSYKLQGIGVMIFLIACTFNPFLWSILGLPFIAIMIPVSKNRA